MTPDSSSVSMPTLVEDVSSRTRVRFKPDIADWEVVERLNIDEVDEFNEGSEAPPFLPTVRSGVHEDKGRRGCMEDRHCEIENIIAESLPPGLEEHPKTRAFFGVSGKPGNPGLCGPPWSLQTFSHVFPEVQMG
jgi:hypothetical protein